MNNLPKCDIFHNKPFTFGHLPSSYLASLTYEEQLLHIGKHIEAISDFINDVLEKSLNDYINEKFNYIMMNAMYEEDTETLSLYFENKEVD